MPILYKVVEQVDLVQQIIMVAHPMDFLVPVVVVVGGYLQGRVDMGSHLKTLHILLLQPQV